MHDSFARTYTQVISHMYLREYFIIYLMAPRVSQTQVGAKTGFGSVQKNFNLKLTRQEKDSSFDS